MSHLGLETMRQTSEGKKMGKQTSKQTDMRVLKKVVRWERDSLHSGFLGAPQTYC